MTLEDILLDVYALEDEMRAYERKYGVLSENLLRESYVKGEEPPQDAWVRDWTAWGSAYQVWLRRREQYAAAYASASEAHPAGCSPQPCPGARAEFISAKPAGAHSRDRDNPARLKAGDRGAQRESGSASCLLSADC